MQIGISLSDYNEMTPYELDIAMKAYRQKMIQQQEENIAVAWLGEYFHRLKKLKKLEEYLPKENKPKRIMTDEEMKQQVIKLNALFGGNIEPKGSD
jgi:hypothetical protein